MIQSKNKTVLIAFGYSFTIFTIQKYQVSNIEKGVIFIHFCIRYIKNVFRNKRRVRKNQYKYSIQSIQINNFKTMKYVVKKKTN